MSNRLKMRILSYGMLCLIICGLAVLINRKDHSLDKNKPVIELESDSLLIRSDAAEKELLQGVSAYDQEDGDLTDKILVEGISDFREDKSRTITYVVADHANNVSRIRRSLEYKDYEAPRFELLSDPCYNLYEDAWDSTNDIRAVDAIDGDISDQIRLIASSTEQGEAQSYTYQVNNSAGDHAEITVNVSRVDISKEDATNGPKITLNRYVLYTSRKKPDYLSYVKEILGPVVSVDEDNDYDEDEDYDNDEDDDHDYEDRYEKDQDGQMREKLSREDVSYTVTEADGKNAYVDYVLTSRDGRTDTARMIVIRKN